MTAETIGLNVATKELPRPTVEENLKYKWTPWNVRYQEKVVANAVEALLQAVANLNHITETVEGRQETRESRKAEKALAKAEAKVADAKAKVEALRDIHEPDGLRATEGAVPAAA